MLNVMELGMRSTDVAEFSTALRESLRSASSAINWTVSFCIFFNVYLRSTRSTFNRSLFILSVTR